MQRKVLSTSKYSFIETYGGIKSGAYLKTWFNGCDNGYNSTDANCRWQLLPTKTRGQYLIKPHGPNTLATEAYGYAFEDHFVTLSPNCRVNTYKFNTSEHPTECVWEIQRPNVTSIKLQKPGGYQIKAKGHNQWWSFVNAVSYKIDSWINLRSFRHAPEEMNILIHGYPTEILDGVVDLWSNSLDRKYYFRMFDYDLYLHSPNIILGSYPTLGSSHAIKPSESQWVIEASESLSGYFHIKLAGSNYYMHVEQLPAGHPKYYFHHGVKLGPCPKYNNDLNCQWTFERSPHHPNFVYIKLAATPQSGINRGQSFYIWNARGANGQLSNGAPAWLGKCSTYYDDKKCQNF